MTNLQTAAEVTRQAQLPEDASRLPKTTGERYYGYLQFTVGKAFIMGFTAVFAYLARYGKESYAGVPNVFKMIQERFHFALLNNKTFPLREQGEFAHRFAAAAASTMAICHGGNLFAPVMKWLENDRDKIAAYFNDKFGKPGETRIGHAHLKDTPQQSWGDVVKGRLAAWGLVFSSFVAIDWMVGKDKATGMYKFDKYEEGFGRLVAGFTKKGKEIWHTPLTRELSDLQKTNRTYRFGKILALDFYATTAAIIIWTAISRMSAKKRNGHIHDTLAPAVSPSEPEAEEPVSVSHAGKIRAQQIAEPQLQAIL